MPYALEVVDIMQGAQKQPGVLSKNPMGKIPTLVDGDLVVTEAAAIALYLADRYAPGSLAPGLEDPRRGTYLRWSFFAPGVIEPAVMAQTTGWQVKEVAAGWGTSASMLAAVDSAIAAGGPYLLGEQFTMADVVFGGTLRFMLDFKQIEPTAALTRYVQRLQDRPAARRADAKNAQMRQTLGLQ